jgi:hypothetical protein
MFNVLIIGLVIYYFYKNNIKTGKLKKFMRQTLPNIIDYLQNFSDKIDGSQTRRYSRSNTMSIEEARQILGVKNGASKEEILGMFKKLMLINHPDKGGTEYIAAKIIQAKQTLIK